MELERNVSWAMQDDDNFQDIVEAISSKFTILELSLPEICLDTHDQLIRMQKQGRRNAGNINSVTRNRISTNSIDAGFFWKLKEGSRFGVELRFDTQNDNSSFFPLLLLKIHRVSFELKLGGKSSNECPDRLLSFYSNQNDL